VSATTTANCNVSASTLDFGSSPYIIASNIDSTATVTVQCTSTTPYSIGLDNGTNASGSQRRVRLGTSAYYINYNLYTDAARSNAWAATTSTTSCTAGANTCFLGTGTGSNQTATVYGRVPSQTAPAQTGTFTDTVVITVTY
jgi:spore coat protein U-like protein